MICGWVIHQVRDGCMGGGEGISLGYNCRCSSIDYRECGE